MGKPDDFLMLAHQYKDQNIGGWFVSTKLDGMRAFWDGGVSIGMKCGEVPFWNSGGNANPNVLSTGLWSRLGKVIRCPSYFTACLPKFPLDGELWAGNGSFQEVMSICKRHEADDRWGRIHYKIFDSPIASMVHPWLGKFEFDIPQRQRSYEEVVDLLSERLEINFLKQERLPLKNYKELVEELLKQVVQNGSEGLMFRKNDSIWIPKRSNNLLKYKPYLDSEGIVVGFVWGEGKFEKMLGSLIVEWTNPLLLGSKPIRFELSGFTDFERSMKVASEDVCKGKVIHSISNVFPLFSKVTFKYRELTNGGIPKEARYWRI